MLVTHRGVSGPAVLQASSYWRRGMRLVLDFAPGLDLRGWIAAAADADGARRDLAAMKQALREVLPQRLAGFLAEVLLRRGGGMRRSRPASRGCAGLRCIRWDGGVCKG
jgi:predicted flavoprotein YhiN